MATRVTQANKEILASGQTTNLRVTQNLVEVLVSVSGSTGPITALRVTQAPIEALVQIGSNEPVNKLRVTQAPIEVLVEVIFQLISMEDSNSIPEGDVPAPTVVLQTSQLIVMGTSESIPEGDVPAPTVVLQTSQLIVMGTSESIPEGDVQDPTVALISTPPPPPPPVNYYKPSAGGKGKTWRPTKKGSDFALRAKERGWKSYVQVTAAEQQGVQGLGRISNGLRWMTMGRQRRPFFKQGSIVTPGPSDLDVPVVDFTVPEGYYGWISGFWWSYTGTGYEDGSNDLHWRIRIGDAYPDGYGDVRYQMGTATDPILITGMIPLRSRSRVQLIVFVKNDSGAIQVGSSRIIGGLTGWFYEPEQRESKKRIR